MHASEEQGLEIQILNDIKASEKKAEDMLAKAKEEKEAIIHDAVVLASKLFSEKSEAIRTASEKKLADSRDKSRLIREEKILEGKNLSKQLKAKASKNIGKAADYIIGKFEELI